jgi:hypothetical protein
MPEHLRPLLTLLYFTGCSKKLPRNGTLFRCKKPAEVFSSRMRSRGLAAAFDDVPDRLAFPETTPVVERSERAGLQLNRQQMEKLGQRFHVSPAVFF